MTVALASLIELDKGSHRTATQQIVTTLRAGIIAGKLAPGWRLPPTRSFAAEFGVTRSAAVHAYAQLSAEGWLDPQGRKGTFVALRTAQATAPSNPPTVLGRLTDARTTNLAPHLDWRIGQACVVALPIAIWRRACREAGRTLPPTGYGDPQGDLSLREEVVTWMGKHRGVSIDSSQVVITQGATQAIELLSTLLVRSGDVCAVENPGYVGAAKALERRGAVLKATRVDADGMDVDHAFSGRKPTLVHVTAAHQYPTGVPLSGLRRRKLLSLADRHQALIIENEYDHEFIHSGLKHAPLFASAPDRVVLVGTFAKAISPALRLGFVVASRRIANELLEIVSAEKGHVSWPVQRSVSWILRSGEMERHLRRVHRHCAALRQTIRARIGAKGSRLAVSGDAGGLHVVIQAKDPHHEASLAASLKQAHVALERVEAFEFESNQSTGIIFGYGHMRSPDLKKALDLLCRLAARTDGDNVSGLSAKDR